MRPRFPYVLVLAPAERGEELGAMMFELGSAGVEVRDQQTGPQGDGLTWSDLAPRMQPVEQGQMALVASFSTEAAARQALADLRSVEPELDCRVGELIGDEWRDRYKQYFAPFALTATVQVVPSWAPAELRPASTSTELILMDPGRAFGTGLHATTALVAEQLERRVDELRGQRLLDVGTGSGILALLAIRLGARSAEAVDSDPHAVAAALANVRRNELSEQVRVSNESLAQFSEPFDFVVANIEAAVLCSLSEQLRRVVAPGGTLILSGVLHSELSQVAQCFSDFELLQTTERESSGGDRWVAMVFK